MASVFSPSNRYASAAADKYSGEVYPWDDFSSLTRHGLSCFPIQSISRRIVSTSVDAGRNRRSSKPFMATCRLPFPGFVPLASTPDTFPAPAAPPLHDSVVRARRQVGPQSWNRRETPFPLFVEPPQRR